MIRQFRKKTIQILQLIFWGVLIGILVTLNLFNYHSNVSQADQLLSMQDKITRDEDSEQMDPPLVNGQELTHIYTVSLSEEQEYSVLYPAFVDEDKTAELYETASGILEDGRSDGYYGQYRYHIFEQGEERLISFLDYSIWAQQQSRMLIYSLVIGVIGVVLLFFVAKKLGEWMTRPVVEAFEKQKQFISDAGHELKTPLAVVHSSLDMLENEIHGNKYISFIRSENNRMTELAQDLLLLTNLEDQHSEDCHQKMGLSHNLTGAVLSFESVAFEQGVKLEYQIEDGINIVGDEKQIRKMVDVLLDNAMKHVYKNGNVVVTLKKEKEKVLFSVANEGDMIPLEDQERIFDRFYRADKAREHKVGRYGLGLSIAKVIVQSHKGKITVKSEDGWTTFFVQFPIL